MKNQFSRVRAPIQQVETYEWLMDLLEDCHLGLVIKGRQGEKKFALAVDIDEI